MSNRANETAELLRTAGRRLHEHGQHDLGDLLRDLGQGMNVYSYAGEQQLAPIHESARAIAERVLAEPDQADGVCAQASAASADTANCGTVAATLNAIECFRLAHEHIQVTLQSGVDHPASQMHRLAADHYLAQACAMAAAQAQGVL